MVFSERFTGKHKHVSWDNAWFRADFPLIHHEKWESVEQSCPSMETRTRPRTRYPQYPHISLQVYISSVCHRISVFGIYEPHIFF